MLVDLEAVPTGQVRECRFDKRFGLRSEVDVCDGAARPADEMVVMPAQVLGQLEVRVIRSHRQPAHRLSLLQDGERAIDRTLGNAGCARQDLGNRQRLSGIRQHVDDQTVIGCESPALGLEAQANLVMEGIPITGGYRPVNHRHR